MPLKHIFWIAHHTFLHHNRKLKIGNFNACSETSTCLIAGSYTEFSQPVAASPVNTSFLDEDMTSWGEQFSQGDQGGNKKVFYVNGYSCCPTCEGTNFTSETHCAGVRRNGDGYGTEVFTCKDCSWETSFQYDEASDNYYYETRGWETAPTPVAPTTALTEELVAKYNHVRRLISEAEARDNMRLDGIVKEDIDKFFAKSDP